MNMKNEVQRLNEFMSVAPALIVENKPFTEWLTNNGFFSAPASTKYHGAEAGGLYTHSKAVADDLLHLTEDLKLKWQREESPFIIGMFHDLCKIDQYKEVVDEPGEVMFGTTEPVGYKSHYEYQETLINGHGAKSIIYISRFLTLTEEEIMCIRFHMGAFYAEEKEAYSKAVELFPNVLFAHTADMIASKIRGV